MKVWFQKLGDSILNDVFNVKTSLIMIGSFFLHIGKLEQNNWMNMMIMIAGFHTTTAMTSIIKGAGNAVAPTTVNNVSNSNAEQTKQ